MNKNIGIALGAAGAVLLGALGFKMTSSADSVNINIAASAPTVEKEEIFNMTIEVSSDVTVQSLDSLITYNPEVLEFVSCEDDAVAGASGTIHIIDTFEEGTETASYELTFKALEVGESNVTLGETIVQEYGSARLIDAASSPVSILVETNNAVSSDNTLSDLLVYPGEFDESFAPDTYEYHLTVGVETENVILSAVPADENAVVTVDIPETLIIGENTATICVKALSGDEAVYTVYITRLAESIPDVAAFSLDDDAESEDADMAQSSAEESESTDADTSESGALESESTDANTSESDAAESESTDANTSESGAAESESTDADTPDDNAAESAYAGTAENMQDAQSKP